MEEVLGEPIQIIRSGLREEGEQDRRKSRMRAANESRKSLGEVEESFNTYKNVEVSEVAARIKHKNNVSLGELKKLKHSFLQSDQNIAAFLNVPGALQGLVRELSGHNTDMQFAALNCCCNLALGDEKLVHQLTKASISYITPNLEGLNNIYMDTCLWTIGNMAGSGVKSWSVLKSQGVLNKLLHLLASTSADVRESAIYALTQYVNTGYDELQPSEFTMIADNVYPIVCKESSVYWLLFLLTCSSHANHVFLMNTVTLSVLDLLINEVNCNKQKNTHHVTALLRALANLCGEQSKHGLSEVLQLLDMQSIEFLTAVNCLLASSEPHVQKETLWFLGNLLKKCPDISDLLVSIEDRIGEAIGRNRQS